MCYPIIGTLVKQSAFSNHGIPIRHRLQLSYRIKVDHVERHRFRVEVQITKKPKRFPSIPLGTCTDNEGFDYFVLERFIAIS